jgi:hypothetical protein
MKTYAVAVLTLFLCMGAVRAKKSIVRLYGTPEEIGPVLWRGADDCGIHPGQWMDFVVEEKDLGLVRATGLPYEIVLDDVEEHSRSRRDDYLSWAEARDSTIDLAVYHPDICVLDTIGYAWEAEARPIQLLKISDDPENDDPDERAVLFTGLHHAREYPSLNCALFVADSLIRAYGEDPEITDLVDNLEIYVIPCVNPDGYHYDHDQGHDWRKNRHYFPQFGTYGVDLNRNYWGACSGDPDGDFGSPKPGVTNYPDQSTYCGPYRLSEPEIRPIGQLIIDQDIVICLFWHTYGEWVLYPWGYTYDTVPQYDLVSSVAQGVGSAIGYTAAQAPNIGYTSTGTAEDGTYGYTHFTDGFSSINFTVEACTQFQPSPSTLFQLVRDNFQGALYCMEKADSIYSVMNPRVIVCDLDVSEPAGGEFELTWGVTDDRSNPLAFEVEELEGLNQFEDDAETANAYWTFDGFSRTTSKYHSGSYSYVAENANGDAFAMATVHPFLVQEGDSLTFWTWHDIEVNYDMGFVEVSEDGRSWTFADSLTGKINGNSGGWIRMAYSLEGFTGQSLYLRFRYATDSYVLGEGFYVDDIFPVSYYDEVETLADTISGSAFTVTGKDTGEYLYRVRGQHADWGWCDFSPLLPVSVEDICGDAKGDGMLTPGDAYMILNYLGTGPQPVSCWAANVNGDGSLTPGDGYHFLNFLGSGPPLNCAPCDFSTGE